MQYVDQERGSPQYPKPDQIALLRKRPEIPPPETLKLEASRKVMLDLPAEGVALLELA